MKLRDLNAYFVDSGGEGIQDADGNPVPPRTGVALVFECPCGCKIDDGSRALICVNIDPPLDGGRPISERAWKRIGSMIDDITLEPSIVNLGCPNRWHGFVRNGEVTNA